MQLKLPYRVEVEGPLAERPHSDLPEVLWDGVDTTVTERVILLYMCEVMVRVHSRDGDALKSPEHALKLIQHALKRGSARTILLDGEVAILHVGQIARVTYQHDQREEEIAALQITCSYLWEPPAGVVESVDVIESTAIAGSVSGVDGSIVVDDTSP